MSFVVAEQETVGGSNKPVQHRFGDKLSSRGGLGTDVSGPGGGR